MCTYRKQKMHPSERNQLHALKHDQVWETIQLSWWSSWSPRTFLFWFPLFAKVSYFSVFLWGGERSFIISHSSLKKKKGMNHRYTWLYNLVFYVFFKSIFLLSYWNKLHKLVFNVSRLSIDYVIIQSSILIMFLKQTYAEQSNWENSFFAKYQLMKVYYCLMDYFSWTVTKALWKNFIKCSFRFFLNFFFFSLCLTLYLSCISQTSCKIRKETQIPTFKVTVS